MADVIMPQMGESIVEGTLTKWLKSVGDKVERDEPLFEISTDKVDTEIPAPAAGVLSEILVEEGATVSINSVVARIAEDGAAPRRPRRRRRNRRRPPSRRPRSRAGKGCGAARPPPEAAARSGARRVAGPPVAAGAQDGARKQCRSHQGEGHRRRRPHHQGRCRSLSRRRRRPRQRPR